MTQRGSGDVRVRRVSGPDPKRIDEQMELLRATKEGFANKEAKVTATAPATIRPTPVESNPMITTTSPSSSRQVTFDASQVDLHDLSDDDVDTSQMSIDERGAEIPTINILSAKEKKMMKSSKRGGARKAPFRRPSQ